MVNLLKLILSLLVSSLHSDPHIYSPSHDDGQGRFRRNTAVTKHEVDQSHWQSVFTSTTARHSKSIAIIGAGSCGLSSVRTFLDVAETTDQDWEIVLFEKRGDVGGVWLPEEKKPEPPVLPETPVHEYLRVNIPHPLMANPGFTFPPMTNPSLLPTYDFIQQYHSDFASHYNLTSYIRYNHTVTSAAWIGSSTSGVWNLTSTRPMHESESESKSQYMSEYKIFDHLVVAPGTDHFPHIVTWPGFDDWLSVQDSSGRKRIAFHSIYYKGPEDYVNKTVLVVGDGVSGADIMLHTTSVTRKMYWSFRNPDSFIVNLTLQHISSWPHLRPTISHFTTDSIFFSDDTNCSDVDIVIFATGYERRIPFLEEGGVLHVIPPARSNDTNDLGLVTNLKYYFPLHQHILPIVPQLPANALGIVGLLGMTPRFYVTTAQTLYFAYAIIDPEILPSREDMLREVYLREERLRKSGVDPYIRGHVLVDDDGEPMGKSIADYMDELVKHLKDRHVVGLPHEGKPFVDQRYRQTLAESFVVTLNWPLIGELGEQEEKDWLKGVQTEGEWAELMDRVAKWKGGR